MHTCNYNLPYSWQMVSRTRSNLENQTLLPVRLSHILGKIRTLVPILGDPHVYLTQVQLAQPYLQSPLQGPTAKLGNPMNITFT